MIKQKKEQIVVAGATGFIGQGIGKRLAADYNLVGLTRNPALAAKRYGTETYRWRQCDLFSKEQVMAAMEGADRGIYLVHSMIPSARLTQGNFRDMDLICADNFARAARRYEFKQIIHFTGIIPKAGKLSEFLTSRLEVENELQAYETPVTTLRAGMVIGAGGSSTEMIVNLARRLPWMGLPRWVDSLVAPIALSDVVELMEFGIANPEYAGDSYDIGGSEVMTFRDLLEMAGQILGRKSPMISLPATAPRLSTAWVGFFSGQPRSVVRPLVESLRHDLLPEDLKFQQAAGHEPKWIRQALEEAIEACRSKGHSERKRQEKSTSMVTTDAAKEVRSVQRLPLPGGRSARWVAAEYARWLPRFMGPFIKVERRDDDSLRFYLRPLPWPMLILELDEDIRQEDLQLFWIRGGMLAARQDEGRLEFREVLGGKKVLAAIHDFRPRLPWFIYRVTQAKIHSMVMGALGQHLQSVELQRLLEEKQE